MLNNGRSRAPTARLADLRNGQNPSRTPPPSMSSREGTPRSHQTPRWRKGPTVTGRSPGSRVNTFAPPSQRRQGRQWHDGAMARRSQLRAQPRITDDPLPGSLLFPSLETCHITAIGGSRFRSKGDPPGEIRVAVHLWSSSVPKICGVAVANSRISFRAHCHAAGTARSCPRSGPDRRCGIGHPVGRRWR